MNRATKIIIALVIYVFVFSLTNYIFCASSIFTSCEINGRDFFEADINNILQSYLVLSFVPFFVATFTMLLSEVACRLLNLNKVIIFTVPLFATISATIPRVYMLIVSGSGSQSFAHDLVFIIPACAMAVFVALSANNSPNKAPQLTPKSGATEL